MKEMVVAGEFIEYGKFEAITLSAKSNPGDGKHGNGVKGGRDFSSLMD